MSTRLRGRRLLAAAAAALVALGVLAGVLLSSSGDSDVLEWAGTPEIVPVPELPRDRVLVGEVRNTSDETLRLRAEHVVVIDEAGRRLDSTARFAASFGHGLYSPADPPDEVAEDEQRRLGAVAEIAPGATSPLVLSWRLSSDGERAVSARIGNAVLDLPEGD